MSEDKIPQKSVLLINTGSTKKRFILQRLAQLKNLKLIVANSEKNWAEHYVDDWILTDTNNHLKALKDIKNYAREHQIDGVLTFWEDDVLLTSKVADSLGLIGIPYQISAGVRNKAEFRAFCTQNGLPAPKNMLISAETDFDLIKEKLKFPVVIKPVYGASSAFVIKADDFEEFKDIYQYIKIHVSQEVESALHEGTQLLVEEYIDGDEVDIDMLLQNGKVKFWSVCDNYQTQEPFFMETNQAVPSQLPENDQEELVNMAESALEKLGIMNGCIHFEAKYSSHGPVPIEVNLRMGGDEVYSFIKEAWGVDFIEYAVKIALGEYFPMMKKPEEPKKYMVSKSFIPPTSGIISSLILPKTFGRNAKVDEFHFYKKVGDPIYAPPLGYDFMGWMSAYGDNPLDAEDNLEAAYKEIEFEIIPFSGDSAIGKTKRPSQFSAASLSTIEAQNQLRMARLTAIEKKDQRKLKIGIACNQPQADASLIENELFSVGKNIKRTLDDLGYQTVFIDFNDVSKAIIQLQSEQIDLVFNVAERINGSSLLEPHVAAILDSLKIPYTGSNPLTLAFCIDKIKVKKLLTYHQIPTAKWDYIYDISEEVDPELNFPLIVKPANTDNSIGITQESVVSNRKELKKQISYVINELRCPALIEEYLDGDEYDVSIIDNGEEVQVLPLSRTVFKMPKGMWNIYTFDAKYGESNYKQYMTVERPPKNVNSKLLSLISEIALDSYSILDAHDYARIEVKLDRDNNPHVLELNPNPSINIPDCVPAVAQLMNIDYGEFLERIIDMAIERYRGKAPYQHLQPRVGSA